ncbi:MAG: hypothetical protein FJ304_16185 [Planctomycetes bacterium]|nr:hypothetical protein [Planctomycetota bacterium]
MPARRARCNEHTPAEADIAFRDFAYPDVITQFALTESSADLFPGVPELPASAALQTFLGTNLTLANLINTEKARSERWSRRC